MNEKEKFCGTGHVQDIDKTFREVCVLTLHSAKSHMKASGLKANMQVSDD